MPIYQFPVEIKVVFTDPDAKKAYDELTAFHKGIQLIWDEFCGEETNTMSMEMSALPELDALLKSSINDPHTLSSLGKRLVSKTVVKAPVISLILKSCEKRWGVQPAGVQEILQELNVEQMTDLLRQMMTVQSLEEFEAEIHKLSSTRS